MDDDLKVTIEAAIKSLTQKAAAAESSDEAARFSQAAGNLAGALMTFRLRHVQGVAEGL